MKVTVIGRHLCPDTRYALCKLTEKQADIDFKNPVSYTHLDVYKRQTQEAIDFIQEVPEKLPFMATSCCPAWSMMAKKLFPEHADCISMALTPMTLTARLINRHHSNAKVVFIGPCAAKKLEAMRTDIRSDVDFVLTFEEMDGIFDARHVDVEKIEEDPEGVNDASTDGRNFAVARCV